MDINGSEGLLTRERKAIELVAQGKTTKKSSSKAERTEKYKVENGE